MLHTTKFSFLKIYVMGATEIDFVGIAHVKVIRAHCASENIGVPYGGKFCL